MDSIVRTGEHDIYLTLSKEALEKTDGKATAEAQATYEKKDKEFKDQLLHGDTKLSVDEFYFDESEEVLELSGNLTSYGEELGYAGIHIKMEPEILVEIISHAIKKLNKFKTVMEAIN